ncbi:hypothetical protein [Streptomyces sp. NPDC051132]|uniref:hypothetical protein n=1 Tax=unclassified Streptomyces TaxID=2593676 RepID=UPI0034364D40
MAMSVSAALLRRPWEWDENEGRRHAGRVPAERGPRPEPWSGGARRAATPSFGAHHETIPSRHREAASGKPPRAGYGARTGAPRVPRLPERHGVPATHFRPAVSAPPRPDEARGHAVTSPHRGPSCAVRLPTPPRAPSPLWRDALSAAHTAGARRVRQEAHGDGAL